MRGDDPMLARHLELREQIHRVPHRFPIRLAPHDDGDERSGKFALRHVSLSLFGIRQ